MKRIFSISLITIFMVCIFFPNSSIAGNGTSYTVYMQKSPKNESEHNQHLDNEGRRMPPVPICCSISKTNGLHIDGLYDDIISYEILDSLNGINLALFSDELEFLDFLFTHAGNYKIKLETENYYIIGYIETK